MSANARNGAGRFAAWRQAGSLVAVTMALAVACTSTQAPQTPDQPAADGNVGGQPPPAGYTLNGPPPWGDGERVEIYGTDYGRDTGIWLNFGEEGVATGSGGCNRFSASYSVDGEFVSISDLRFRDEECKADVRAREATFFEALRLVARWHVTERGHELLDESGEPIVVFTTETSDPPR